MVFVRSLALALSIGILLVVAGAQPPKPEKASAVVPLDEDNFEQQTKAASGQSNGKWFVKFYAGEIDDFFELSSVLCTSSSLSH